MNATLLAGLALLSLTASLTIGCAEVPEEEEEQGSSASEIVSQSTFARASTIVKGVDYLAFGYKADGCYARALYMSAELASQGIESNSIYAFAQGKDRLHIPNTNQTWAYHVAPMLKVSTPGGQIALGVLDPSMSSTPLTASAWVLKMGHQPTDPTIHLASVEGSNYPTTGDELYGEIQSESLANDVASFIEMGKFSTIDIQSACGVQHAYLALEGGSKTAVANKQNKLVTRTKALLTGLRAKKKLVGGANFNETLCRSCVPVGTAPNVDIKCGQ